MERCEHGNKNEDKNPNNANSVNNTANVIKINIDQATCVVK